MMSAEVRESRTEWVAGGRTVVYTGTYRYHPVEGETHPFRIRVFPDGQFVTLVPEGLYLGPGIRKTILRACVRDENRLARTLRRALARE